MNLRLDDKIYDDLAIAWLLEVARTMKPHLLDAGLSEAEAENASGDILFDLGMLHDQQGIEIRDDTGVAHRFVPRIGFVNDAGDLLTTREESSLHEYAFGVNDTAYDEEESDGPGDEATGDAGAEGFPFEKNIELAGWAGDDTRESMLFAEHTGFDLAFLEDDDPAAVTPGLENAIPDRYGDIRGGKPGAVDAFLQTGQDPNIEMAFDGRTALFAALDAPGRNARDIEKLIAAGADVSALLSDGGVFYWMGHYEHPDTVDAESELALAKLLSAHGADIHHMSTTTGTALECAIPTGRSDLVRALLDVGADANQLTSENIDHEFLIGANMLTLAAPRPELVRLLLDYGADPNRPDANEMRATDFIQAQIEDLQGEHVLDDWTKGLVAELRESLSVIEKAAAK